MRLYIVEDDGWWIPRRLVETEDARRGVPLDEDQVAHLNRLIKERNSAIEEVDIYVDSLGLDVEY